MELPLRWISSILSNSFYRDRIRAIDHVAWFVDCAARRPRGQRDTGRAAAISGTLSRKFNHDWRATSRDGGSRDATQRTEFVRCDDSMEGRGYSWRAIFA